MDFSNFLSNAPFDCFYSFVSVVLILDHKFAFNVIYFQWRCFCCNFFLLHDDKQMKRKNHCIKHPYPIGLLKKDELLTRNRRFFFFYLPRKNLLKEKKCALCRLLIFSIDSLLFWQMKLIDVFLWFESTEVDTL